MIIDTIRKPGSTLAAMLMLAAVCTGCASLSAGPDATLKQRIAAARTDLATASLFVTLYASFPECAKSVPQPCSSPRVVALLDKAQIAARAALDAVDALIAAGSPEERVLVALQEAEKAIRLLQALKADAGPAEVQVARGKP